MAFIQFFDASETDKQHLSQALSPTDHRWEFIEQPISLEALNPDAEVISIFVSSSVTKAMIDALPRLRLIACRSTGFNNVDLAAADARGIVVVNVPSYGDQTVAEYTFTLLFALSRKLLPTVESVHDGHVDLAQLTGFDLAGKTLGIVGAGRIGQSVARIAKGIGMQLLAYDPFPKESLTKELGLVYRPLDEVLAQADVVTLHTPYTKENHHLLNQTTIAGMKPGAVLINTARGELVDTKALIEALKSGHLAGAAVDVIEGEKMVDIEEEILLLRQKTIAEEDLENSVELAVLSRMPNAIVTPHNAFNTLEAIQRINNTTTQNIIQFWYGETPNRVAVPPKTMGKLIVARHGESEWNALGKWTGTTDVHLSEKGFHDAALMGLALKDIHFDYAYVSQQIRTLETMQGIVDAAQQFDVPFERADAINERDYGDYTGKNKWEVKEAVGEDTFNHIRRDWDYPVPNGETLKVVYERTVPFYTDTMVPRLRDGQNVLVVAHGNSIRSLMKYIEDIADKDIAGVEMLMNSVIIYEVDEKGRKVSKTVRTIDSAPSQNA